ncbi:flagellar biosynthesis anti-sigma factor FlgM [Desulfosporosinus sp. HMP52]|uniref:flagellar biosynthesis anti-sigma factor FlgM n=1 Tax=Desulfosporosinus sp. HMP52 TaxID=1487923 RepID=UPI00051FBE15|nr:flagellar biosynthesis anti-sigma factor FlgM [Desulfosporosinus sp. HMP52]KGK90332.1 flagellar biosynthesis anti-sigma factor FlgM [Desulfosporosinus sp. HMP52]
MKIDRTSMSPVSGIQAANRLKQVQNKTTASEADKIAVSDKAQVFQSLLQKAKETPSVREERVKALTEQIERGEFQVDSRIIADKLFSQDF